MRFLDRIDSFFILDMDGGVTIQYAHE